MRISDWSSDVCSSDLLKAYQDSYRSNAEEWDALTSKTAQYIILGLSSIPAVSAAVKGSRIPAALLGIAGIEGPSYIESQRDWKDRKIVVSGKSVSVRVDLGVRCIL